MQSIGIIPEAGGLAGGKSAGGNGGTSADGFLALLAALDGGAGLLLPPDLRGEQKKALGQSLTGNLQANGPAATANTAQNGNQAASTAEASGTDATLIAAAVNGAQTAVLPNQNSAQRNLASQNSQGQLPQQAPAVGPSPDAPLPQTSPTAPPGGQAIDPLAPTATAGQPAAAPKTGSSEPTTKSPAPQAAAPNVTAPSQSEQNAKQAQTPAAPVAENSTRSGTQQATTGKTPASESPAPQLAAQTHVANQPQAQAQAQVKSGGASIAPAAVAPRSATNPSGDSQVTPNTGLAQDGSRTPGNDQPSVGRERTLMASTHQAKAAQLAKAAKQAKAVAAAEQQVEQNAKLSQGAEQQVAQNAQQSTRPALWTAALASIQALQSVDSDSLGQGMGSIDSGVEPLTSPSSSSSTTAKAGSEGYSQMARSMPTMPPSEQLAVQIQRAVNAQVQRFSIRLEPAELGRIDVRLDFARDGSVNAAITVERPETFDLMQRDIQALERSLKENGVQGEGLKLDLQLGTGRQEQQDTGSEQSADYRQSDTADEELPTLPDLPAISRAGSMTGLIDIRA